MDYEKKYKEALEELKLCARFDIEPAKTILKLFPELEESDYVIKQRLIHLLGYFRSRGIDHDLCNRILNWLEKQKENNLISTEEISKSIVINIASSLINYLDNNRYEGAMNMSSIECEDLEKSILGSDWGKVYRYMQKKLENQGDYNKLVEEMKERKELLSKEKKKAISTNDKLSLGGRIAILEELLAFTKVG